MVQGTPVRQREQHDLSVEQPPSTPYTLGVEEEFFVVDPDTRRAVDRAPEVIAPFGTEQRRIKPELQNCMVEGNSDVATTLADLRADLVDLRSSLVRAAEDAGVRIVAVGSAPLADPDELSVQPDPRFLHMREEYQLVAREQLICGLQCHVGLPDESQAFAVIARVTPWLPVLLAMTASSPYWQGVDTGYASYRTMLWKRWPTAGLPPPFASIAEHDGLVDSLVRSGAISDAGMVYYDLRFNRTYRTVEFRICDACPSVDDAVLVTGLARALVRTAAEEIERDLPAVLHPLPLVEAAKWRAARSGMSGSLVDLAAERPVPAGRMVAKLVDHVGDALEASGDWAMVSELLARALARRSAAEGQRVAAAEGGLTAVVDRLIEETAEP
jgi:carboxylate-amine ligase